MFIRTDCRHYLPDRPCRPHKQFFSTDPTVVCPTCRYYAPSDGRILIVKIGAMGDVLRTTCILPGLREKYPRAHVTWIVAPESQELLENLDDVDRVLPYGPTALNVVLVEQFDLVINLDLSPDSTTLASAARAKQRLGFAHGPRGEVVPLGSVAEDWNLLSHFDDRKRANVKTYQRWMLDILGLHPHDYGVQVRLTAAEKEFAQHQAQALGLVADLPVVGVNFGAGGRWRWKRWTPDGYLRLFERLHHELNCQILLLAGQGERDLRDRFRRESQVPLLDCGCENTLRQFMAFVELSDLVVTGDTLALHIACGLGKPIVALFGPTSAAEVELYGKGVKLQGDVPCLCCYLTDCTVQPSCMESLSPDTVVFAASQWLTTWCKAETKG